MEAGTVLGMVTSAVATVALMFSCFSWWEARTATSNSVRPALLLLEKEAEEKHRDKASAPDARSFYIVNMGNAVALDVKVLSENLSTRYSDLEPEWKTKLAFGLAAHRRRLVRRNHAPMEIRDVKMVVVYRDINGRRYRTEYFGDGAGPNGRGPKLSRC